MEDEFLPEEARSCGLLCAGLDWDARPDEGLAGAAMASAGRMAAMTARVLSFMGSPWVVLSDCLGLAGCIGFLLFELRCEGYLKAWIWATGVLSRPVAEIFWFG